MKILIIEDEAVAARRLERLTREILGSGVAHIEVAHGLLSARAFLDKIPFDLLLLDLKLAGEDGFEVLSAGIGRARLIIVSAFPDRAIEAFGYAALDFVPKPVIEARLRVALDRFRRSLSEAVPERMIICNAGCVEFVDVTLIIRISGADDYSEILLLGGRTILTDRRLGDLVRELPAYFIRVHRSYIANLRHASALERQNGQAFLCQIEEVITPISRRSLRKVEARLEELFGASGDDGMRSLAGRGSDEREGFQIGKSKK